MKMKLGECMVCPKHFSPFRSTNEMMTSHEVGIASIVLHSRHTQKQSKSIKQNAKMV